VKRGFFSNFGDWFYLFAWESVTTFRSYFSTIIIDGHFSMMAKAINFAAGALLLLGAVRVCYIATIKKDRM